MTSNPHSDRPAESAGGPIVRLSACEDESPVVEVANEHGTTVTVPASEVSALIGALLWAKSLTEAHR